MAFVFLQIGIVYLSGSCVASHSKTYKIGAHHLSILQKMYWNEATQALWANYVERFEFLDISRRWHLLQIKDGTIKDSDLDMKLTNKIHRFCGASLTSQ